MNERHEDRSILQKKDSISLMGFNFISSDFETVLNMIEQKTYLGTERFPFLITPNAETIMRFTEKSTESSGLKEFFENSYFILPDGFPIMVYSKLTGKPLKNKLSGSDLFPLAWPRFKKLNRKILLIAPNDQVGNRLQNELPTLRYYVPPFFSAIDIAAVQREVVKIQEAIRTTTPDYVLFGLGFPKQERLSKMVFEGLAGMPAVPLFMLLGASFEFYLGIKKRAPRWMQRSGLEWLHRFMQEPRRLWKRYTIGNLRFMAFFLKELIRERFIKTAKT
jgi:N-acetylglucosaminyldiphosphoundecaprenol N-acetyl-beta-D-mannosaminyltransferase